MDINKVFKHIFLIAFFVLTIFFGAEGFCADFSQLSEPKISAPNSVEKFYLNNKENELALSASTATESTIAIRRNNSQNIGFGENPLISFFNENNIFNSYYSSNSYLENKTELALLLLKHQIQPNGP